MPGNVFSARNIFFKALKFFCPSPEIFVSLRGFFVSGHFEYAVVPTVPWLSNWCTVGSFSTAGGVSSTQALWWTWEHVTCPSHMFFQHWINKRQPTPCWTSTTMIHWRLRHGHDGCCFMGPSFNYLCIKIGFTPGSNLMLSDVWVHMSVPVSLLSQPCQFNATGLGSDLLCEVWVCMDQQHGSYQL